MAQRGKYPPRSKSHFMTLVISFNYFSALGAKWAITSEYCCILAGSPGLFVTSSAAFDVFQSHKRNPVLDFYSNATDHTHTHTHTHTYIHTHTSSSPCPYLIIWDNCKEENSVAQLFKTRSEVLQGELGERERDYGSVTSDFSLLLLIASIVWTASCGKRSTGYYTQIYYPWQTKWDEKREIIVKEPLPQDGITQSLQGGWFPSDWSTLRNSSCALVVRRSPVTSPPPVCVFECMAYCVWKTYSMNLHVVCLTYSRLSPFFSSCYYFQAACSDSVATVGSPTVSSPFLF